MNSASKVLRILMTPEGKYRLLLGEETKRGGALKHARAIGTDMDTRKEAERRRENWKRTYGY